MRSGIYAIYDRDEDLCLYVGLSKDIDDRWRRHRKALGSGLHSVQDFADWFISIGSNLNRLDFRLLENVEPDHAVLRPREVYWFELLHPRFYGVHPGDDNFWSYDPIVRKAQDVTRRFREMQLTKEIVENLYYDQELSIQDLADLWDCSLKTVYSKLKHFDLKTRHELALENRAKPCVVCSENFVPVRSVRKTCSKKCGSKLARESQLEQIALGEWTPNSSSSKMRGNTNAKGNRGGKKTAHNRWHVARNLTSPDCDFCKAST